MQWRMGAMKSIRASDQRSQSPEVTYPLCLLQVIFIPTNPKEWGLGSKREFKPFEHIFGSLAIPKWTILCFI